MNENIKINIIDRIIKLIPPQLKAVDYLSDLLNIGKESAYRRLRGEIAFSVDELIILSNDLDLSIDELVGLKNDSNQITIDLKKDQDPLEVFMENLIKYKKEIDIRLKDENSDVIMALNHLPLKFCVHHKELFKFSYYTWLHQNNKKLAKLRYSDLEIPAELENIRNSLDIDSRKVKNNTFILDSNVFRSILKEVSYFYKLRLINDEDILKIKDEFHSLINLIEKMVRTGSAGPGTSYYFYLSDFNIEVTGSYNVWDGNITSSFNIDTVNKITISNPEICEAHKEWLESLKRYSTLISESNEIAQAEFFEKQRKYIDQVRELR